ncbi:MAG: DUF2029 domain-containing protein [Chitinispirillaceae bacterium]|nr:DUF2029 domain-containing protein [Chitinispirillaceae bacterium]
MRNESPEQKNTVRAPFFSSPPEADRLIGVAVLILAAALLCYLLYNIDRSQWDFRVYYYAAKAFLAGNNPYDLTVLREVAGRDDMYNFVYPPLTLVLFVPLTLLGFAGATVSFLLLKTVLFFCLITIWCRCFLKEKKIGGIFLLFLLFGFNAAVFEDLKVGNISIIEQILLWGGLCCYVSGKYIRFGILVSAAASFKLLPIVFLLLLLFTDYPKRYLYTVTFFMLFAAVLGSTAIVQPALFQGFLANSSQVIGEGGASNPSLFTLVRIVLQRIGETTGVRFTGRAVLIIWLPCVLVIGGTALPAMLRLQRTGGDDSKILLITLFCLSFSLLHPRFKDYSYILTLFPAWILLKNYGRSTGGMLPILLLMMLPAAGSPLPGMRALMNFYPLLLVMFLYGYVVYSIFRSGRNAGIPLSCSSGNFSET